MSALRVPSVCLFLAAIVLLTARAVAGNVKDYVAPAEIEAALAESVPLDAPLGHGEWHGDTYVLPYTLGSSYDRVAGGQLNIAPRQWVAQSFYQYNPDTYDFIVVFTGFDFDTAGSRAFYSAIKNDVQGIGLPQFDSSAMFGSVRLQGYVDASNLTSYLQEDGSLDQQDLTTTLNHEIAHRWLAHAQFIDPSGNISTALLGRDGSHWSYLLDSDASYLYGSKWTSGPNGTYTAIEVQQRYNALDLYLMGLVPKEDVSPLTLLVNPEVDSERVPGLGDTISAQPSTITVGSVVAANGQRIPDAANAPKELRIAFVFLIDPSSGPAQQELDLLNNMRSAWKRSFFQQTGGRALVSAIRGIPPFQGANAVNLRAAASWLAGVQQPDGSWRDSPDTPVRETAESVAALQPFGSIYDLQVSSGSAALPDLPATSTELIARKAEFLLIHGGSAAEFVAELQARGSGNAGWGAFPRYAGDPVSTALAIRAFHQAGQTAEVDQGWNWLVSAQNPDGGWGWRPGGASAVYPTLEVLVAARSSLAGFWNRPEVQGAIAWLFPRQTSGGFGEPYPSIPDTSLFLQVAQDSTVSPGAIEGALGFLAAQQGADGSWQGSAYQTALALDAAARFGLPDLSTLPTEIYTDPESPYQDDEVTLHVAVINKGAFLPAGTPYRWDLVEEPTQIVRETFSGTLPEIQQNDFILFSDTRSIAADGGAYVLRFAIDPDRIIPDRNRANNTATIPFTVKSRAAGIDLELTGFSSAPGVILTVPQTLTIQGSALNHGLTDAAAATVRVYDGPIAGGVLLGTADVSVPSGGAVPVSVPIVVNDGKTYHLTIHIEPANPAEEADDSNNGASLVVPIVQSEDMEITSFQATPPTAIAGEPVTLTAFVKNSGTVPETGVQIGFTYVNGIPPSEIPIQLLTISETIQPAETRQIEIAWTPVSAGSDIELKVTADPQELLDDSNRSNNSASASISVEISSLPNLSVTPASIGVLPPRPVQGQIAHVTGAAANYGSTASGAFTLQLRLDDPVSGQVLGSVIVDALPPGATATVEADWNVNQQQNRLLYVVADPENSVAEFNEQDNRSFIVVDVQSLPDLVLTIGQVQWTPAFPPVGEPVQFSINILNAGDQDAANVALELVDGSGSVLASQNIASVPAASSAAGQLSFTPGAAGELIFSMRVNHGQSTPELSFENNEVSFVLPVQNADMFLSDRFFSPNGDGVKDTITVYFRNPVVRVEVFDGKGVLVRSLNDLAGLSAVWDGRADDGRVVQDGGYELRAGNLSAWAIVDNNLVSISDHPRSRLIDGSIPVNGALLGYSIGPQEGSVFYVEEHQDGVRKLFQHNGYEAHEIGDWPAGYEDVPGCSADASTCLARDSYYVDNYAIIRYPGATVTPVSPPFAFPVARLSPDGRWILWVSNSDAVALQSVDNPGLVHDVSPCHDADFCESYSTRYRYAFWSQNSTEALAVARSRHGLVLVANLVWIRLNPTPSVTAHVIELPVTEHQSCYEGETPLRASVDFEKEETFITSDTFYGRYRLLDGSETGSTNSFPSCEGAGSTSNNGAVIRWSQGLFDVRDDENISIDPLLRNAGDEWSPADRSLFSGGDSNGVTSFIKYSTVADNLLVALRPRVLFGNAGIELNVLVVDRNLDRFTLEYADAGSPGQFSPIGAPSREPIFGDVWGAWIPPHKGRYILRLTALDLAGNTHSVSRAVTWNGDNDIANLYSETRYISPAASPGSKDTFVFKYFVLRPANLVFRILDAEDRVVRTLLVAAPQAGDAATVWDGKDDFGNFVTDGKYSLEYLSARWPVTVDNTPPAASFSITPNVLVADWDGSFPVNLYRNRLEVFAEDGNLDRWIFSSRRAGSGDEWGVLQAENFPIPRVTTSDRLQTSLPTDSPDGTGMSRVAGKDFKFEVTDVAGNSSYIERFHKEEQIAFADSEPSCRADEDHPCIYPQRPGVADLLDNYGLLDYALLIPSNDTHLAQPLLPQYNTLLIQQSVWGFDPSHLRLEYRTHTPVGSWNQGTLLLAPVSTGRRLALRMLGPPVLDAVWMGYWEHEQLPMRDYEVRLVAINRDGEEIASHIILYAPKGLLLEYLGTDLEGVRVRVTNQTEYLLSGVGVSAYAAGTSIPTFGSIPFLMPGESEELSSGCLLFSVLTGPNGVTFQAYGADSSGVSTFSNPVNQTVLGAHPALNADFTAASDCSNTPPPVGLSFQDNGRIYSPGGPASLVSQMMQEPTGSTPEAMEIRLNGQILASAPYSAVGWPTFHLDFSSFPESPNYRLSVTYRFPSGQDGLLNRCALEIPLTIDRTPPSSVITSPVDGSVVCTQDLTGSCPRSNFVPVSSIWTGVLGILQVNGETVWNSEEPCGANPFSPKAPEGFTATYTGEYELIPQSFDSAGWYGCGTPVHVTTFSGITLRADPQLFSPVNTLGRPTGSSIRFTAGAPGMYVLDIRSATGAVVRSAAGNASQGELVVFAWDGRDGAGTLVPDGVYTVNVELTGSCTSRSSVRVEVDKTPPSVAVLRPVAGQEVGAVLEAQGLALDKNFSGYELQVRATGDCETCWSTVDSHSESRENPNDVLGVWDTGAFPEGEYDFRIRAIDEPGNVTIVETSVSVYQRLLIRKFSRVPDLISPANADGNADQAEIRYALLQNSIVELAIRDMSETTVVVFDAPGAYQAADYVFTWDGRDLSGAVVPDGAYIVRLQATKPDDPTAVETLELTIVIDNNPPETDVTNIVDDGVYGLPLPVRAFVSDSHPREYSIKLVPPAGTERVLKQGIALNEENVTTLSDEANGEFQILIHASDRAFNSREFQRTFTLDSMMPVAQILNPGPGGFVNSQRNPISLEGLVSAPHPDHYEWAYAAGESPLDSDFVTIFSANLPVSGARAIDQWDASALPEGDYTLRLKCFDQLGRVQEDHITFHVDNTLPLVEIQQLAAESTVSVATMIHGLVLDPNLRDWKLEVLPDGAPDPLEPRIAQGAVSVQGELGLWSVLPPDGMYSLRLTAADLAENESETAVLVRVEVLLPEAPINLTGMVENMRDARLTWQPAPGSIQAGYNLYRDGVRINPSLITSTQYIDAGLQSGIYSYAVRAVSPGSQESGDSNTAVLNVDLNPPLAIITVPAPGQRISGTVEIAGTAFSEVDFKEYRLLSRPNSGDWLLLAQRSAPVLNSTLANWDTAFIFDGGYELRLEVEDLDGNIGVAGVNVVVDNTPPETSPVLLGAVKSAQDPDGEVNDVFIHWSYDQPPPDFGGYFLYRNGQLANAAGPVIGSQLPFLLQNTDYNDKDLPDGTYIYSVTASDLGGNESAASNSSDPVLIETRRPHAVIAVPQDGASFTASVIVVAESPDSDIVSLQFEYKRTSDLSWTSLGAPLPHPPFSVTFFPPAYDFYQIRAVAADAFGADPAPDPVTVTHVRAVPALEAHVDGGDVTLNWPAVPDPYGTLQGYNIYRFDVSGLHRVNTDPINALTYLDSDLPDGGYDYRITSVDQGIESEQSENVPAYVYKPSFAWLHPIVEASAIDLSVGWVFTPATVELQSEESPGGFVTVRNAMVTGLPFGFGQQPLSPGMQTFRMLATDAAGNKSKPSELLALVQHAPPAAVDQLTYTAGAGSVDLSWTATPDPDSAGFTVRRDGVVINETETPFAFDSATHAITVNDGTGDELVVDGDPATGWKPDTFPATWQWTWPDAVEISGIDLTWASLPAVAERFEIDIQAEGKWLWLHSIGYNGQSFNTFAAGIKATGVRVRALDEFYWHNTTLTEVQLKTKARTTGTSYLDSGLAAGAYDYSISRVNRLGQMSSEQNIRALVDIQPPPAPVLNVAPTGSCGELLISWQPPEGFPGEITGYRLYRTFASDGIYQVIADPDPTSLSYFDVVPLESSYKIKVYGLIAGVAVESTESAVATAQPECPTPPDPPVITYPTTAGNPIILQLPQTDVEGTAALGAIVHLIQNGQDVAQTDAGGTVDITHVAGYGSSEIAFSGNGRIAAFPVSGAGGTLVAVRDLDADTEQFLGGPDSSSGNPSVSADGEWIAYVSNKDSQDGSSDIIVFNRATGQETRIVASGNQWAPSFSFNGNLIAYVSSDGIQSSIVVLDRTLNTSSVLYSQDEPDAPVFSPDGSKVLAATSTGLVVIERASLQTWKVPGDWTYTYSATAFSPDGSALLYSVIPAAPSTSTLWKFDLQQASSTQLSTAQGEMAGLFRNADTIDFLSVNSSDEATVIERNIATAEQTSLYGGLQLSGLANSTRSALMRTSSGALVVLQYEDMITLPASGGFRFPDVALAIGTNTFVARQEFSGTLLDSEPVSVAFSGAILPDAVSSVAAFPPFPISGSVVLISGAVTNTGQSTLEDCKLILQRIGTGGLPVVVRDFHVSLAPGETTMVRYEWNTTGVTGDSEWSLIADADALIVESNETNNTVRINIPVRATTVVEVDASTNRPVYLPGQSVGIHVRVFTNNPPADYAVQTLIEDAAGYLVEAVETRTLTSFGPGIAEYDLIWQIQDIHPGDYRVHVRVIKSGIDVAVDLAPFAVLPPMYVSAQVSTVNTTFVSGELVSISGLVQNTGQATVHDLTATFRVVSEGGDLVASEVRSIAAIPASGAFSLSWVWQSAGSAPGNYTIRLEVKSSFDVVVADAVPVAITLTQPAVSLNGSVALSSSTLEPGEPLDASAIVTNTGAFPLQDVQIDLIMMNPSNLQVFGTDSTNVNLQAQQSVVWNHPFATSGMPLGPYLLLLRASGESGGPFDVSLAQAGFVLNDATAPEIHLIAPAAGLVCDRAFLQVQATDALSGIRSVASSVDQGAEELVIPPLSTPDMYGAVWPIAVDGEGPHQFEIAAQDFYGNPSNTIVLDINADVNPPVVDVLAPDGQCLVPPVQPAFNGTDLHLASVAATLNGLPYESGAAIGQDGAYALVVTAEDACAHTTTVARNFVLDGSVPSIAVTGVADGEIYTAPVKPVWSIQDANLSSSQALLNGVVVEPGVTISETGSYTLAIVATDCAQNSARVIIHFEIAQHAPVAEGQSVSVDEDALLAITLHATDTDGDPLAYEIVDIPAHGALNGQPPLVTYSPAHDFHGADSFTFRANDGHADSGIASVDITVFPVNDLPVADSQAINIGEDTPAVILLTAHDTDGDVLTYSIVSPPSHGTLRGQPPRIVYIPDADYFGKDSLSFKANDGRADSNAAIISIRIQPVNDVPVAVSDRYTANKDFTLYVREPGVLANDQDVDDDVLTAILIRPPLHGALILYANGSFRYIPNASYVRDDSFTYKVSDGALYSEAATVTITVRDSARCPDAEFIDYAGFSASDCDGVVEVQSQAELDAYEMDFGAAGNAAGNLDVNFNPTGNSEIVSPCRIRLNGAFNTLATDAGLLCLYGRGAIVIGLASGLVRAKEITLVSEEGSAEIANGMILSAESISIQVGSAQENKVIVGSGASLSASSLYIEAPSCHIAPDAMLTAPSQTGTCFEAGLDRTPPRSFISCSIPLQPPDPVSEVPATALFTLGATDVGSEVAALFYMIDDQPPVDYSGPFDLQGSVGGDHTICYFSRDTDGNQETPQCIAVRIQPQGTVREDR